MVRAHAMGMRLAGMGSSQVPHVQQQVLVDGSRYALEKSEASVDSRRRKRTSRTARTEHPRRPAQYTKLASLGSAATAFKSAFSPKAIKSLGKIPKKTMLKSTGAIGAGGYVGDKMYQSSKRQVAQQQAIRQQLPGGTLSPQVMHYPSNLY